jgi:hypothetical protein
VIAGDSRPIIESDGGKGPIADEVITSRMNFDRISRIFVGGVFPGWSVLRNGLGVSAILGTAGSHTQGHTQDQPHADFFEPNVFHFFLLGFFGVFSRRFYVKDDPY